MLRKGMWVNYKGKVGILVSFNDVVAEVHLVDEKGHTTEVVPAELHSLSQAAFNDIPKPRRPDLKVAKHFGYA